MLKIKLSSFETDPEKLTVCRQRLIHSGALDDGSFRSRFCILLRTYCLIVGFIQYSVTGTKTDDFLTLVEVLHWLCDFTIMTSMSLSFFYHNETYLKMEARIKSGFHDYGGQLTPEQIQVRGIMNENGQLISKVFLCICYSGLISTYMQIFFPKKEYELPYPMWFPHEILSMFLYVLTLIYVLIVAETLCLVGFCQLSTFTTLSLHLIAQYQILIIAIKEIDSISKTKSNPEEKLLAMHAKLKTCTQHHVMINRYFDDLHRLYSVPLLTTGIFICISICTLGFILLSPDVSLPTVGAFSVLFFPEGCIVVVYCLFGQKIADVCEEFGSAIYFLDWYEKPLSIQKDLLMLLIGTKKKNQLTGFGPHKFSMKGLSEIIQATFSYFNMLRAMN